MRFFRIFLILIFIGPLLSLFLMQGPFAFEVIGHIIDHTLFPSIQNTLLLLVFVGLTSYSLGILFVLWLYHFSLRIRYVLLSLLVLPLAWPSLNVAYLQRDLFSYSGPLMTVLRDLGLSGFSVPGLLGATISLSTVLVPYIVMGVFFGFLGMTARVSETIKVVYLGWSQVRKHLVLRPMLKLGIFPLMAVCFEVLSDFGAVSVWNLDTLSALVLKTWFSMFSIQAAKALSWIIILIAVGLLLFRTCLYSKIKSRFELKIKVDQQFVIPKDGFVIFGWFLFAIYFCLSFLGPILVLSNHFDLSRFTVLWQDSLAWISKSLVVQVLTLVIISIAILAIHAFVMTKFRGIWSSFKDIFYLGYAIPGTILVVAFLPIASFLRAELGFVDSFVIFLLLLVWAYLVKYATVGLSWLDGVYGSFSRSHRDFFESNNVGVTTFTRWWVLFRFHLKQIFPVALILWLDILKELPLMLSFRPFGYNSLMTKSYDLISEGFWAQAMPFTVILFFVGAMGVFAMLMIQFKRWK